MQEIHYLIWNSCNLNCGFCFWDEKIADISLDKKKLIIDEIVKTGIRKITLSWWEPLSSSDFLEVIKYAKSKNLEIILHSNWLLINENNASIIAPYIDRLSLTLDWVSSKTQRKMRWTWNITEHTLDLIRIFNKLNIPVNIKTLVTRINKDEIENIWEILSQEKISYWSLLELIPLGRWDINKDLFILDHEEFKNITNLIKDKFPSMDIRTRDFWVKQDKYCFISADWKIYTNQDWKDILIWDIFNEKLSEIISKI